MTQFLPPNLLALFAPRDPLPYLAPAAKLPHEKVTPGYAGVAQFMTDFEDPKETPPPTRSETKDEKKDRVKRERQEAHVYKLEQELAMWDPQSSENLTDDAFKTLFVARINFDTTESKLRREFEVYGPVKSIRMVNDQDSGKPRGYAFIEYENERDMHSAYKHADGKKIDGRRVLVDVERARTVKGWRPRRLGGGLGSTRKSKEDDGHRDRDETAGSAADRRDRDRSRSKDRDRRRRSRSPKRRSRSRERRRSRDRERDRGERSDRGERDRSDRADKAERDRGDRDRKEPERERGDREERKRSRSKERSSKRSRRSRSREKKRSRSRERKRSKRSRSRDRRKDRDVKVKTEKMDDGYPVSQNGEDSRDAAPQLEEGESQSLTEYPMPADSNGAH